MSDETRISDIEQRLRILAWLHAEMSWNHQRVAQVVAMMLTQQMQPQVQQAILAQLNGQSAQGPVSLINPI